jgi:hypothetical protein
MQSPLSRCASSITTSRRGPDSRSASAAMSWNRLRLRARGRPGQRGQQLIGDQPHGRLGGNASVHTLTWRPTEPGTARRRSRSSAASTAYVLPVPAGPCTTPVAVSAIRSPMICPVSWYLPGGQRGGVREVHEVLRHQPPGQRAVR